VKWEDISSDAQATWLSDAVTIAYLDRLKAERETSHNSALMSMRNPTFSAETAAMTSRRVGEMDAYNKAIEIATRTE
jgi:hypothetical protein